MSLFADSFKNFVANLGTGRDKAAAGFYASAYESPQELVNAYRGAWLPRKIVDIPANDATRNWRNWQAEADAITKIEAEEKRLGVKTKVNEALKKSRLYGGAAIYIGIEKDDPATPLRADTVTRIDFLNVMTSQELTAGEIERDPFDSRYGYPKYYTANARRIHPSRLCLFYGAPYPDDINNHMGWADSVLTSVMSALRSVDSVMANIDSLVYEAKVDVLGIPNLGEHMSTQESRDDLTRRVHLVGMLKGNNGMLVKDALETYESKSFAFSNLDNIGFMYLQVASGAADIPATRLIGMSPGGLNASGESDYRNYNDKIKGIQENDIGTGISILDECLIRSALGNRPEEVYYVWAPLWQPSAKERADMGKTIAETIKTLAETGLIAEQDLSLAAINMLTEWNIMPGLEQVVDDADTID